MSDSLQQVPIDEAGHEVALASRRVALLHIAYARMLVDEFGPERGREMIVEAIRAYGQRIGDEVRAAVEAQGLDPTPENYGAGSSRQLPAFGMCASVKHADVDGERRLRVHGCVMGEAWREIGEADLGRLYCLVDAAGCTASSTRPSTSLTTGHTPWPTPRPRPTATTTASSVCDVRRHGRSRRSTTTTAPG